MRSKNHYHLISWSILVLSFLLIACGLGTHRIPRWGIGGLYLEGKDQFWRGKGGDMDKAIAALESVVREDPMYKDSLTLVARAYYRKARYEDARQILQRALAVNKEDEIAWLVLGLTQLRQGEEQKGLETLKGAITLVSRVSKDGYRDFSDWDARGVIRSSIRRVVLLVTKGLDEKENLFMVAETLLTQIDDEENFQRVSAPSRWRSEYNR